VGRSDKNLTKTSPPSKQTSEQVFSNPALLEYHIPKSLKKLRFLIFRLQL